MEEIAIIGVGCKLPGADDTDQFWRVLQNGENHVLEVPADRWNLEAFYDADPAAPGKTYVRRAGFIKNQTAWDNKVYGINDFEASQMDPQQRFVLDCCFKALENAGVTKKSIDGTNTGVYIGVMNNDYKSLQAGNSGNMNNYTLTGTSTSIVAARISYNFNLLGPSLSLDTACSSSLLAIHLATQALREGDCDMALAGGVNSLMSPEIFIQLSKARMASPTGYCQAFSDKADGYARGEGAGILLLKRLKDAERDNDPIWATIMTGSNQDGHTVSPMTAPSGSQQLALLEKVYKRYNIDPNELEYLEAHGTGTQAGDPVEANCLGSFLKNYPKNSPKYIGSVKTNIGHLESAAGVAGVIKVLLMQKHSTIVPTLHFDKPNEKIDFEKLKLNVATKLDKWPSYTQDGCKLSCVNSFSFGGTNCHAVVKSYNKRKRAETVENTDNRPRIICFSGTDDTSLNNSIEHFCEHAKSQSYSLANVSYTSTVKRDHYTIRMAKVVRSMNDAIEQLETNTIPDKVPTKALQRNKHITFVFCGMGSTWSGMCKEMLANNEVFYNKVVEVDCLLHPLTGWSIRQRFEESFNPVDPYFGPIASFTCQVALDAVWKSWGIKPDCIIGQSVGEVAAAYASGALSLGEAVKVIYHRTYLQAAATGGSMLVVGNYDVSVVEEMIAEYPGRVQVAVHNSPMSCSLAGDTDVIDDIRRRVQTIKDETREPIFLHDLTVTSAFHSHHMEECSQQIKAALGDIKGNKPTTKLYSTVSGKVATDKDFVTADYWAKNVRQPVQFRQALQDAFAPDCFNIFLEIGSKPVLSAHAKENFDMDSTRVFVSMKKELEEPCIMQTLTQLYVHGVDPDWQSLFDKRRDVTDIPQYRFNPKESLLIPEEAQLKLMGGDAGRAKHPFLRPIVGEKKSFKIMITPERIGSVYEHFVMETILVPGALYGEVGLAIADHINTGRVYETILTLQFKQPLVLHPGKNVQLDVTTSIEKDLKTERERVRYNVTRDMQTLCVGSFITAASSERTIFDIEEIRDRCDTDFTRDEIYNSLRKMGFVYGTPLQVLADGMRNEKECLIYMNLPEELRRERVGTLLHPAILDGMLQTPGILGEGKEILPVQIGKLRIFSTPQDKMVSFGRIIKKTKVTTHYDIFLLTEDGELVAEAKNFITQNLGVTSSEKQMIYNINWRGLETIPVPNSTTSLDFSNMIVINNTVKHSFNGPNVLNVASSKPLLEQLGNLLDDTNDCKAVVYMSNQGASYLKETTSIFKGILQECLQVRELVLHMTEKNIELPFFVITENAWIIDYTKQNLDTSASTPSAAALWGMMRTVGRELHGLNLKLLDVNREADEDMQTLLCHLIDFICPSSDEGVKGGEFVYSENQIHSLEFLISPESIEHKYKEIDMNENCNVKLFSQARNEYINPFMILSEPSKTFSSSEVVLKVDTLVIQNGMFYSPCVEGNIVSRDTIASDGFQVIAMEAVGHIDGHEDVKYVSCCPTEAGTTVIVPKSCLISLEHLPVYQPGLVMKTVLMWSLCKNIVSPNVTILYNTKTKPLMDIMRLILKSQQKEKVQVVSIEEMTEIQNEALISFVNLNKSTIFTLMEHWQNPETLSTVSTLIDNVSIAKMHNKLPNVRIEIFRTEEIFSPFTLDHRVPEVNEWIKTNSEDLAKIAREFKSRLLGRRRSSVTSPGSVDIMRLLSVTEVAFSKSMPLPPVRAIPGHMFRKDAAYVVVGGLTGLGWECVKFMAANGAGHLVCFNRRKPSEENLIDIEHLEKSENCRVGTIQVDVTSLDSVINGFDEIKKLFPRSDVKGVIFGAAVLKDAFIESMDSGKFSTALSPKVRGAWNLHLVTKDLNLDYFVMHSSITGILGNQGQANYGAGNAFEDGLAHLRRSIGLPGQSFNWGPLNLGMLKETESTEKVISMLKQQGYELLEVEEIHHCLMNSMLEDRPQTMLSKFDLGNFGRGNSENETLMSKFHAILNTASSKKRDSITEETPEKSLDIALLKTLDTESRIKALEQYMSVVSSKVFAIDESLITSDSSIVDLGIDSMLAMTIIDQVSKDTRFRLPMVVLLSEGATINKLATTIEKNIPTTVQNKDNEARPEQNEEEPEQVTESLNVVEKETAITEVEVAPMILEPTESEIQTLAVDDLATELPPPPKSSTIENQNQASFIERELYLLNKELEDRTCLHYTKDIIFKGGAVNKEIVKACARKVTELHSIARTCFTEEIDDDGSKSVQRSTFSTANSIDFREIDGNATDENFRELSKEEFDLNKSGPVRFICSSSPSLRIRVICHRIGFDASSVKRFIVDFQSMVVAMASNKETPVFSKDIKSAQKALQLYLASHEADARDFWKENVPNYIPRMNLSVDATASTLNSQSKVITAKLTSEISQNIFSFLTSHKVTMEELFISLYQQLLSYHTKHEIVVVLMKADLRWALPTGDYDIANFTNDVPAFARIPFFSSFRSFIKENKAKIKTYERNAVLPFSKIAEMAATDDCRRNMNTHCVVHEDLDKHVPPKSLGLLHDTLLIVHSNESTQEINVQLQYKSDLYSEDQVKVILHQLQILANHATTQPGETIADMESRIGINKEKATFKRANSNGHNVRISDTILPSPEALRRKNSGDDLLPPNSLSYSEYYFYERYMKDNPIGHHIISDIHASPKPDMQKIWYKTALTLISRHKTLRTLYVKADEGENYRFGLKKIEKRAGDILDFQVVENSKDDAKFEKITRQRFDFTSKGCLRFIFANEPSTRVRVICHHIPIDFFALGQIMKDLRELVLCIAFGLDVPPSPSEQVDSAALQIEKAVRPIESDLKTFWQSRVKLGIPDITLRATDIPMEGNKACPAIAVLPTEQCVSIFDTANELKTSVFKLFASVYQLYFHFATGHERIVISAPLDLRTHLPHTRKYYENMMNAVPLFAEFNNLGITTENYIQSNTKDISQSLAHGIYSVILIRDLLEDGDKDRRLTRHSIVEEDMATIDDISKAKNKNINSEGQHSLGFTYETRLMVWVNKKTKYIRLHLECLPEYYTLEEAKSHLDNIQKLMNVILSDKSKTLAELKSVVVPSNAQFSLPPGTKEEIGGRFYKETSKGYDHIVYAKLSTESGQPVIKWASIGYRGKSEPKSFKSLKLSEVKQAYFATYKGFRALVLETSTRNVIFKFLDVTIISRFSRQLGKMMNDEQPTQNDHNTQLVS